MVLAGIPNPLEDIKTQLQTAAAPMQAAVESGSAQIAATGGDACDLLGTMGAVISDIAAEAARFAENAVAALLAPVVLIGKVVDKVLEEVFGLIDGAINALLDLGAAALAELTNAINTVVGEISGAISAATSALSDAVSAATEAIGAALDEVAAVIDQALTVIGGSSCKAISAVVEGLGGAVSGTLGAINDVAEAGLGALEAIGGGTLEDAAVAAAGAASGAAEAASGAVGAASGTLEASLQGSLETLRGLIPGGSGGAQQGAAPAVTSAPIDAFTRVGTVVTLSLDISGSASSIFTAGDSIIVDSDEPTINGTFTITSIQADGIVFDSGTGTSDSGLVVGTVRKA